MQQKITISVVAVIIGAAIFLAGRGSVSPAAEKSTEAAKPQASLGSTGSAGYNSGPGNRSEGESRPASGSSRPATKEARLAKLNAILGLVEPMDRQRGLMGFLDKLSPAELKEAFEGFNISDFPEDRAGEYQTMLMALAKVDPAAALEHAKTFRNGLNTRSILAAWVNNDPEAAIAWAKAHHDGAGANPYLAGIITGLATTDPARATSLLAEMPAGDARTHALCGMVGSMIVEDPQATAAFLDSHPADVTDRTLTQFAGLLGPHQPELALGYISKIRKQEDMVFKYRVELGNWLDKDPAAAKAYLQTHTPPENVRGHVQEMLVH